jgi:hypothetical protein
MSKSDSQFGEFLMRNSVIDGGGLPLVHSTKAFHLRSLQRPTPTAPRRRSKSWGR